MLHMNTRNKPQQNSISLVVRCFLGLTDLLVTLVTKLLFQQILKKIELKTVIIFIL